MNTTYFCAEFYIVWDASSPKLPHAVVDRANVVIGRFRTLNAAKHAAAKWRRELAFRRLWEASYSKPLMGRV